MTMKPEHVGVVILAAGLSQRMKEFKALLPYKGKESFLESIISTYVEWGCGEVVVVTNNGLLLEIETMEKRENRRLIPPATEVVVNENLEWERFYSVKLGLGAIRDSAFCFIQNVDNPFIDKGILDLIYQQRSEEAYVSPVFKQKGGHPVLLNQKQTLRIAGWPQDNANLKEVLSSMESKTVEMPDDRVLININSRDEYKRLIERVWN